MSGPMVSVRDPKDFWSGLLFIAFGCAGLWFGRHYAIGTAARMGPGYFPLLLSLGLLAIGGFIMLRSLVVSGEPIERIALLPQVLIVAAIVVFALLIERVGLAVSVAAAALLCGLAARGQRWFEPIALAVGLSIACVVLFVYVLGQPIPIWTR
jgi:hypothetical protein